MAQAWEAALDFGQERRQELTGLMQFLAGLALALALVPLDKDLLGVAGMYCFRACFGLLGLSYVAPPLALLLLGWLNLRRRSLRAPSVKAAGTGLAMVAVCSLVHLVAPAPLATGPAQGLYLGGMLGTLLGAAMEQYLSAVGTVLVCLALLAVSVYLLEQEARVKTVVLRAYERLRLGRLGAGEAADAAPRLGRKGASWEPEAGEAGEQDADAGAGRGDAGAVADPAGARAASAREREALAERVIERKRGEKIKVSEAGPRVNTLASTDALAVTAQGSASALEGYRLPDPDLLQPAAGSIAAPKDYEQVSTNLERVLASFGVSAKVVEVCPGPTVTRYEIALAPGVKMSRVVSLADDIALGAKASAVRIEGPIPGKGTLGVEIPNSKSVPVMMRELVETAEFRESAHKLIFALGKDIGGSMIFSNLAEMPHLLVAGSTGSGKSVCLNAIITSVLFRAAPDEVKLLMVDPKRVELTPYDGIPHLLRPVVSNPKEAAGALRLLVEEMEDRYKLLAQAGMRKIDDYNEWVAARDGERERSPELSAEEAEAVPRETDPHRRLPYIVVVVDELADLMMVSANEVENSICRLAQMARGVGIHLVIATQRPSVDVITGVIKANLPSRIAFQVSSKIDSRTILDGNGAEALLGRGDMLYNPYNVNKPVRVQGCFLSGAEVARVVAHVKRQAQPVYDPRFAAPAVGESAADVGEDYGDVDDALYEEALKVVISAGQGSTSVLQRRLKLGFGRASRLLDRMEAEGIIGPAEHNKPRKLLINASEYSDEPPRSAPAA